MMKALFVHSVRFVRTPDGRVFSEGQFSYDGWDRYLKYFDELMVIGRMSERTKAPEKWNLSSGPRVTLIGTPDDHGKPLMQLQEGEARAVIKRAMADCDAVIVRQSKLGWLAAQEAERTRKPWAIEVVCNAWDSYWNYGLIGKLYAPVAEWKSRRWINRAGFAKYVTREYLQQRYPCKGFSVGVSDVQINVSQSSPEVYLENKIARWNTEGQKVLIIGLIGALFNRYKGLHVALGALRRLKEQGIQVHLRVLGNGNVKNINAYRKMAKQLGVADCLYLDGSLPSGDPVLQWLDALDIYIQPSLTEGLPRGLIEAMSRGLPALGSTCGGIPELLPAECLHRPGDDKTLARHLARMVQDKPWRIEQARRNLNTAKYYGSDQVEVNRHKFWGQFIEHVRKQTAVRHESQRKT